MSSPCTSSVPVRERERERERERFNHMSIRPTWPMRTSHCSCLSQLKDGCQAIRNILLVLVPYEICCSLVWNCCLHSTTTSAPQEDFATAQNCFCSFCRLRHIHQCCISRSQRCSALMQEELASSLQAEENAASRIVALGKHLQLRDTQLAKLHRMFQQDPAILDLLSEGLPASDANDGQVCCLTLSRPHARLLMCCIGVATGKLLPCCHVDGVPG